METIPAKRGVAIARSAGCAGCPKRLRRHFRGIAPSATWDAKLGPLGVRSIARHGLLARSAAALIPMRTPLAPCMIPAAMNRALLPRASVARDKIRSRALRSAGLYEILATLPFVVRDAWIDEVLGFDPPPPDIALPRGSVPYVPCGVDDIVTMALSVPLRPDDELVDVGSGLGRVVILGHLLSGAHACGVEIQAPLVQRARARCADLGLDRVSFVHANAADVEFDGSVFFFYAPFSGEALAAVLQQLEGVARRRPIVVCAVGSEFHVPWLKARPTTSAALTLYDSDVAGVSGARFRKPPVSPVRTG